MAAIFFVTAAALLFQVAQTRLFSAAFGYHLTYLVTSVALLGVGWGATLCAVFDARPRRPSLGQLAVAAAASIVLALIVETHVDPMANLGRRHERASPNDHRRAIRARCESVRARHRAGRRCRHP